MTRIFLIYLFCFLPLFAFGQTPNEAGISGKVTDEKGEVLVGTVVYLKDTKFSTVTDVNGEYSLLNVPDGHYTIVFTSIGFDSFHHHITIKDGKSLEYSHKLIENAHELGAVEITGKTEAQETRETGFNVNAIETKKFANTTADLNQILNRSTGIRVREEGGLGSNFNFSLNGLSGKQVKFFLDGIPMETFGSSLTLNNIPVNLVQRMEVYKGVVPVSLGSDALGGAVNIVTNQNVKKFLDASYSYGSFNTNRIALAGRYTHEKTGFTVNASTFYNYSDNNYIMKKIEIWDGNSYVSRNLRRFHDGYQSYMVQLETGFTNKKWADLFLAGILYSSQYKEIQTGINQEEIIGSANSTSGYLMPTFKYSKDNLFIKGLSANLFATYATDKIVVTDTSSNKYGWDQKPTGKATGEIYRSKTIYNFNNSFAMFRANAGYEIDSVHSFSLNYVINDAQRKGFNELNLKDPTNVLDEPNLVGKKVLGLAYQLNLFRKRFTTTILGKRYDFNALARKSVYFSSATGTTNIESDRKYTFYGYGIASRLKILGSFGIKGSFEHAYRLPEPEEILGDGRFILSNIDLKPENSDNINAGFYFSQYIKKHFLSVEGSIFYRNARDFIYFIPGPKFGNYLNAGNVLINGYEGEIKYEFNEIFSATVNASYQNAINNSEYAPGGKDKDVTYLDRIPNQPYLFGNADLGIGKRDLLGKGTGIQLNWFTQYIEAFYLTWPSLGGKKSKNVIPSQVLHNASITYSIKNGRYNISFEIRNLLDALAYDNFKQQKPGRSFSVKFRYFLK